MSLETAIEWVSKNWSVLTSAPLVFVTLALFGAGIGYMFGTWFKNGEISVLERRLAEDERQLADYRDKLKVGTPDEAMQKLAELEKFAPRRLRPDQKEAIQTAFKPQYSYRWSIRIYYYRTCNDCSDYARQITSILQKESSTNVGGPGDFAGGNFDDKAGLILAVADPNNPPPVANELAKALNAAKIDYEFGKTPFGTSDKAVVDLLVLPAHRA
jgi:hypothetical protein